MPVVLVGLNHTTAPLEVRERLFVSEDRLPELLGQVRRGRGVAECAILSTCNRTELYAAPQECSDSLRAFLEGAGDCLYRFAGPEAVRHLFSVACGLNSMILGEHQVLGQVRSAWQAARAAGTLGPVLDRLFPWAVRVGKRARSETRINQGAASVSQAAVELARKIFGELKGREVLVLGAGETSELTLKHLHRSGVRRLVVANRTRERAAELAERCGGEAVPFEELDASLTRIDVLLSSTGAPHYLVTRQRLAKVMRARRNRPLFVVDIAVPRDIDPACAELEGVYLFNLDDLRSAVARNLAERHREVARVKEIVQSETDEFLRYLEGRRAVTAIRRLRQAFEEVRRRELKRASRGLSREERERLDRFSRNLVSKLLHRPTVRLRELGAAGMEPEELERSLKLFGLVEGEEDR